MADLSHDPDLMFDFWAEPKGPFLAPLAAKVTERVLRVLGANRQRDPKGEQVERVIVIVSTVIANLAVLHGSYLYGRRIAVPLKHEATSRYNRQGFGSLKAVLQAMAEMGCLIISPAIPKVRRTGIEADGWLLRALLKPDNKPTAIGRAYGEETVRLFARTGRDAQGRRKPSAAIDYKDTPETTAMRAEMDRVNRYLNYQRIELYGEHQGDIRLFRSFMLRSETDPHRFDLHGRLYGGFWMNLRKDLRTGLTINGETIADLDYVSMFPRLAYLRVGLEPPRGDLYDIPGLEQHRAAAKIGFSALLSRAGEMRRLPADLKDVLPQGWTASAFQAAVAARHPALVPLFGRDLAPDLMFTESRLLLAVMAELERQGVVALPMHDGIMVPGSKADVAMAAMKGKAERLLGHVLPVSVKPMLAS